MILNFAYYFPLSRGNNAFAGLIHTQIYNHRDEGGGFLFFLFCFLRFVILWLALDAFRPHSKVFVGVIE